jgi:hypothetical protein
MTVSKLMRRKVNNSPLSIVFFSPMLPSLPLRRLAFLSRQPFLTFTEYAMEILLTPVKAVSMLYNFIPRWVETTMDQKIALIVHC